MSLFLSSLGLTQCYQWCLTHPCSDSYLCHPLRLSALVMEFLGSYSTPSHSLQTATEGSVLPEAQVPTGRARGRGFLRSNPSFLRSALVRQLTPTSGVVISLDGQGAKRLNLGLGCCVSRDTGMVAYKEPPAASSKSHPIPTTSCPRDGESHSPCTLETATRNESQDRVG